MKSIVQLFQERLNSDQYAQYRIDTPVQIVALLREVQDARSQVVLHFSSSRSIASRVLDVWPQTGRMALDFGLETSANEALFAAGEAMAETNLHQVSVQFHVGGLRLIQLPDGVALEAALPPSALRIQRREAFRVPTPVLRPLILSVPAQGEWERELELRVADISSGGVSTVCEAEAFLPTAGTVLRDCRLELQDVGLVVADLEVRHVKVVTDAQNKRQTQCGMRFLNLSPQMSSFVQRYVMQLEREWRMLR